MIFTNILWPMFVNLKTTGNCSDKQTGFYDSSSLYLHRQGCQDSILK